MYNLSSKQFTTFNKLLSGLVMVTLLLAAVPTMVLAEENASSTPATSEETVDVQGCTDDTATNYNSDATLDDGSCEFTTAPESAATTSDDTATTTDEVTNTPATSEETVDVQGCTDDTATNFNSDATLDDGSCEFATAPESTATTTDEATNDGLDGDTGTSSNDTATTSATTTDPVDSDGADGSSGGGGTDGVGEQATTTHEHTAEPIPFMSDELIGDTSDGADATDKFENQGGERERGEVVTIDTGVATAKGEVSTKANSNNIRSIADEAAYRDLDNYRFFQYSPNEANVINEVAADAYTGRNQALARQESLITTGDAVATFNVANVVNTNIVNSDGYLYLANQILGDNESLDLQDFFFPGGAGVLAEANGCTLNSCLAESIEYNFSQTNHATITNDAHLRANTGDNYTTANRADIITGDAYSAANLINVVNTNIVDSNYRLLTFNAVGDLEGDLILPTEELFDAFFGLPNGLNQLQVGEGEDGVLNVDNQNEVDINNNVDTYAESGLNKGTAIDSSITTGRSESESNVLNKVNENVFGGDLMYLWIRVHGAWSGDVVGLPDGLSWEWGPEGIIIYNTDAEVAPSDFLGYDQDAYTANVQNFNQVAIDNNVYVDAISGRNEVDGGLIGSISTGNTFASANVMNIANTNIIGANWTMAIVNVLGDFDGNVTFARTDLSLSGSLSSVDDPIQPDSIVTFSYTVANSSDQVATDVVLHQALVNVTTDEGASSQSVSLGNLAPGESSTVDLTGRIDASIETGTSAKAVATVLSAEGDSNESDNTLVLTDTVVVADSEGTTSTSSGTGDDSAGDGAATDSSSDEQADNDDTPPASSGGGGGGSGSGGGGGGGSSSKTKSIDRDQDPVDPDSAPMISVRKIAHNVEEKGTVQAGEAVDYEIVIINRGGTAHDAVLHDTLTNPIGSVLSEETWELGTILAGEEIQVEYTTTYNLDTPDGTYTNTASVEAYRHEDSKANGADPLRLDRVDHEIIIDGAVDLAVGNVSTVAYFPTSNRGIGALIVWETSKPAVSQIFYSPKTLLSPFNRFLPSYGYQSESFKFETAKTSHAMIVFGLTPGTEYTYRIHAEADDAEAFGGDYTFAVPAIVAQLTVPGLPQTRVAGAATSAGDGVTSPQPVQPTPPVPVTAAPTSASQPPQPKPQPRLTPTPTPTPEPTPEPEPEPEPTPAPTPQPSENDGFVKKATDAVFGLFGW